jgi:Galactose-3-O-sulfotransferase
MHSGSGNLALLPNGLPTDLSQRSLIYVHIPKAAGSTLERILIRQYRLPEIFPFIEPKDFSRVKGLPLEQKAHYKLFQGHMPFGLHEYLQQPSIYLTQLRDPIQLALSSYYYFELGYRRTVLNEATTSTMPSVDALANGKMRNMFDNMQTRFLSGMTRTKFGECTREMLELAKSNLEQFFVVGLVEQFDESIVLLARVFGWRAPYYIKTNVSRTRPRDQMPGETVDWLREQNRLDAELYAHAKTLLARGIREQGIGPEAIEKYRRRNRWLGRFYDGVSRVKNKRRRVLKARLAA